MKEEDLLMQEELVEIRLKKANKEVEDIKKYQTIIHMYRVCLKEKEGMRGEMDVLLSKIKELEEYRDLLLSDNFKELASGVGYSQKYFGTHHLTLSVSNISKKYTKEVKDLITNFITTRR